MVQQVRAALLARVSSEEQVEGYSLDAQKRGFRALVQARGWAIYQEYVEEGRSAYTDDIRKRPVFKQAIDDALGGKYDVLVVHKIDRFSRKLRITLEYFEKLGKAGVGFVSIQNEMDYSKPEGKLMLVLQGGLAELYSDNLSQEVKKGLAERKAQGLYCGSLPFGVSKGADGVPSPDPETHPGLVMALEMATGGRSDGEIAQALNAKGYRTAGTRGRRLFANHSVRGMLTNRFYVGYLPDGNGGSIPGKHKALVDRTLWDRALESRRRNRTYTHTSRPKGKRIWSLTGLTHCWSCKGRIHTQYVYKGEPRLGCYNRQKGWDCSHKSANLSIYEAQLLAYLHTFHIPEDYLERILEYHRRLEEAYGESEKEQASLERRLKRLRELYEWGDIVRAEYEPRRDAILRELDALEPRLRKTDHMDRLAAFLADVPAAWETATPEQRNKLARTLFEQVWLKDKLVVAVKPRPELEPFFRLNYEEFLKHNIEGETPSRVELYREHGMDVLLAA